MEASNVLIFLPLGHGLYLLCFLHSLSDTLLDQFVVNSFEPIVTFLSYSGTYDAMLNALASYLIVFYLLLVVHRHSALDGS